MPTLKEIVEAIESTVNRGYQESWDNSGWQVVPDDTDAECKGVMIAVDITENVIAEAINHGCNLIVSHHPLIFKPLKQLPGSTPAGNLAVRLIRHNIATYSAHTSLDCMPGGVSAYLASKLGLTGITVLSPRTNSLLKMVAYVPVEYRQSVADAASSAGAGHIGNYDSCSFASEGNGYFRPLAGSNPYVGNTDKIHGEPEARIEMILPRHKRSEVEKAVRAAHPYEEPAIDFFADEISDYSSGLGAVGDTDSPLTPGELIARVKEIYGSPVVRTNIFDESRNINRVALCGGSGGEFLPMAVAAGADAYITSDVRYHDFVDFQNKLLVIDTGHFESENCTKEILCQIISKKFPNFAVLKSETEENSIRYQ